MTIKQHTRLAELGVATVYEASSREGLIDIPLIQLLPGSRIAGPARTVMCGQDDNLMVHAVIEQVQPGERFEIANPTARLIVAPDWKTIQWSEADRKKGQAWGLKTVQSFHTHGTPPVD